MKRGIAVLLTGVLGAEAVWARFPWSIEGTYVARLGPPIQRVLTTVSSPLPLSLAEWVEAAAIGAALVGLGVAIRRLVRGPDRKQVLRQAALDGWIAIAAVGVFFYTAWGLSYGRPPLDQRWGWADEAHPLAPVDTGELKALGDRLVDRTNDAYLRLHGTIDVGQPSRAPDGIGAVDRATDLGFARLAAAEGLDPDLGRPRGPAKPLVFSVVMTYLGIAGFYFPFTGEANLNAMQPEWQMAHTLAHEKAHQRFVASEDEANFYGFLAGVYADDPFAEYGAWLFAQRQVLFALEATDPYATQQIIGRRLPGVQRDVDFSRLFWSGYEGPVAQMGQAVNDRYLRFNGVAGGVQSYSRSLVAIVEWLRRNPARLFPSPSPAAAGVGR